MKYLLPLLLILLMSCHPEVKYTDQKPHQVVQDDTIQVMYSTRSRSDIILQPPMRYFIQYELDHPHWYRREDTVELKHSFQNKLLMDFSYLTDICSYRQKRLTGNKSIKEDMFIPYDVMTINQTPNGDESKTICFQYNFNIPLLDTLPNGKSEYPVYMEIISTIPPHQDETKPFITPQSELKPIKKYHRLPNGHGLYLGTYMITQ